MAGGPQGGVCLPGCPPWLFRVCAALKMLRLEAPQLVKVGWDLNSSLCKAHSLLFTMEAGFCSQELTTMRREKYQSHVSARGERNELSADGWGEEIEVSKPLPLLAACLLFPGITENKFPKNFLLLGLDNQGQESWKCSWTISVLET